MRVNLLNTKNRMFDLPVALLSILLFSGCSLDFLRDFGSAVGQATAAIITYRPNDPEHFDTYRRNPFNNNPIRSGNENTMGFYSGDVMYVTEMIYDPYNSGSLERAGFRCHKEKDSLYISSVILPYPDSFYGNLDSFDKYFNNIAFLIFPKEDSLEDGSIIVPGSRVCLKDQTDAAYSVESAVFTFDKELSSEYYHTGSFEVIYLDSQGFRCKLEGGRLKLYESVFGSEVSFKNWWESLTANGSFL